MKRLILFAFLLLTCASSVYSQAPEKFKFQAVARDAGGSPYLSENLAVRVSLVRDGVSGLVDYAERHEITTSPLGVFDLEIGGGSPLSGDMNNLDWGAHAYYLKIDMDPNSGTNYTNLGTSQLLSVPYAIYAREAANGSGGGDPTDELQNLLYDPNTQTLTLTDGNAVTLSFPGGTDNQTLVYDSNTGNLMISNGNTVTIPAGVTGPQGEAGPAGPPGAAGATGPQGPVGPVGPVGPQGPAGQDGTGVQIVGTVATVGNLPASGNAGDLYIVQADGDGYVWDGNMWVNVGQIQGPQGPQGAPGPAGPQGNPGPQGEQGEQGVAGPAGPQGSQGPTGPAGVAGPQGEQGSIGPTGATGPAGPQGTVGPIGPQGPAGQDGTGVQIIGTVATVADLPATSMQGDLYIVQTDGDGYVWDGSMWVNVGQIQGPQGPQGAMGATGPQGIQGPQGLQGEPGPAGATGAMGPAGAIGATGPEGPVGPAGAQGPQGEPGPAGPQGATGPMGATGPQGPQGDAGPAGTQGVQGDPGPTGPMGATGPQGAQGDPGPTGTQGPQGNPGATGPQGPVGPAGTYTAGAGIQISGGVLSATDASTTNELQSLSLSGSDLQISGGNSVNLSGLGGSSPWSTSGSNVYYNGGNVGIGTASPGNKLHLLGDFRIDDGTPSVQFYNGNSWYGYMYHDGADMQIGNLVNSAIRLQILGSDIATFDDEGLELISGSSSLLLKAVDGIPAPAITASGGGGVDALRLITTGVSISETGSVTATPYVLRVVESDIYGFNIYNGTTEADWEQYVTGAGDLSLYADNSFRGSFDAATGAYTSASDRRLKKDIRPLETSLAKVLALQPSRYVYRDNNPDGKTSIGFVAQDVQALFPELVLEQKGERDNGLLSVNYAGFSVLAIQAIQEQQGQIEQLEDALEKAETEQATQQALIEAMEQRLLRLEAALKE
ncbi:tail fiber domain-containing protein [Lewinella cohaerens]|uniref:tail fiber domain-containing protein n=1 Tax=Lewinella cohaerens TaxID=70995 RepID=UPI00037E9919|nr:tail fiber domain-containing protein [Lewinella cohaerens]